MLALFIDSLYGIVESGRNSYLHKSDVRIIDWHLIWHKRAVKENEVLIDKIQSLFVNKYERNYLETPDFAIIELLMFLIMMIRIRVRVVLIREVV